MFLEPFQNSPCFFFLANFLEKKKACTLVYLLTSQPFSNFLVPCMLPLLISDDCHVAHSLPLGPYWLPLPLFCTWPLLFLKTIIQYFLLFCSKLRGSFLALHDDVWSSQPIPFSHLPFFCRNSSSQPVLLLSYLLLCVTHSVQLKLISWIWATYLWLHHWEKWLFFSEAINWQQSPKRRTLPIHNKVPSFVQGLCR